MGNLRDRLTDLIISAVLICASALLLLPNLGNQYLWQDEAQTALISKTILTHGIPLGHDGKNSFSQTGGTEYGKNYVWRYHPWFPFYLLAGFYAVFGISTFVSRLPFALIGMGTILLAFVYAKEIWSSRRAGILAASLLCLSVPFLILTKQCRYYAPAMFLPLLALYSYHGLLHGRRWAGTIFVLSLVLLFHTHYVYYATLLLAVGVHAAIWRRDKLRSLLLLSGITIVVNLPWVFWYSSAAGDLRKADTMMHRLRLTAPYFASATCRYTLTPALLSLPVLAAIAGFVRSRRLYTQGPAWQNAIPLILFCVFTFAAVLATSTMMFYRFLAAIIPVVYVLCAALLDSTMRLHAGLGVAVLAAFGFFARMPDYVYELTHDYDGPIEGIVLYLKANAKKDDIVAVTHEDLPIKFYTGLRVVGGNTGEDLSPAKNADWVVLRLQVTAIDVPALKYITSNVDVDKYEPITLVSYPDIRFENRESPEDHLFRTDQDAQPVMLFRRIED